MRKLAFVLALMPALAAAQDPAATRPADAPKPAEAPPPAKPAEAPAAAPAPAPPAPAPVATVKPAEPGKKKDQVYKWVDKDGVVHYTNQPPVEGAKPAKLPGIQTYKGGAVPDLSKYAKPTAKPPVLAEIQVVTPAADETFRNTDRTVPVAVVVTPTLAEGQSLVYLLDGTPSEPTKDTSHNFLEVDRGAHSVEVAVVDDAGNEVSRSAAVTFHMLPPGLNAPARQPKK